MIWLWCLIIACLIIVWIKFYVLDPSPQLKDVPSLTMSEFITGLYRLIFTEDYLIMEDVFAKKPFFKQYALSECAIVNSDANLLKEVLLNPDVYPKGTYAREDGSDCLFYRFLGENVIFSNGPYYKHLKSIMLKCFKRKNWNLNNFLVCKNNLMQTLTVSNLNDCDIYDWMQRVTIETMGLEFLNVKFGTLTDDEIPLVAWYNDIIDKVNSGTWVFLHRFDAPWNPFLTNTYRNIDHIIDYFSEIIAERRDNIISNNLQKEDLSDVLSLLIYDNIENPGNLSDDEIRHNILMLFLAGHDTTSLAISAALHNLAEYPKAQDRVREEVKRVLSDVPSEELTMDHLDRMTYLTAVIEETLRMYPSIAYLPKRVTSKDVVYEGVHIPSGTMIATNVMSIHRNAKYWPNPNQFDPNRFLNGKTNTVNLNSNWFAFGGGGRICLGKKFAMIQVKLILSSIIREYGIEPIFGNPRGREMKLEKYFILKPKNMRLKLIPLTK